MNPLVAGAVHCQHTPLLPHSHYARSQMVPSLALLDEEANVPRKLSIRVVRDVEGQAPFSSVLRDRLRGMAARGPAYGLFQNSIWVWGGGPCDRGRRGN